MSFSDLCLSFKVKTFQDFMLMLFSISFLRTFLHVVILLFLCLLPMKVGRRRQIHRSGVTGNSESP